MRVISFSKCNMKEIMRDPLTLIFGMGFPIALLLLFSSIQRSVPVPIFEITRVSPGISVFSLSFITLFAALTVSKDRESAFLTRLYTTPLSSSDFLLGYAIPFLLTALLFVLVPLLFSVLLGLKISKGIFFVVLFSLPYALYSVSLGLLLGSILTSKQVGGICGALLTNLSAWLSGLWFDLNLVGETFRKAAMLLPYYHAVKIETDAYACSFEGIWPHLAIVLIYAIEVTLLSGFFFLRGMKKL